MNLRILLLEIPKRSAFRMAESSLFHSMKKLCLILIKEIQATFLVV